MVSVVLPVVLRKQGDFHGLKIGRLVCTPCAGYKAHKLYHGMDELVALRAKSIVGLERCGACMWHRLANGIAVLSNAGAVRARRGGSYGCHRACFGSANGVAIGANVAVAGAIGGCNWLCLVLLPDARPGCELAELVARIG